MGLLLWKFLEIRVWKFAFKMTIPKIVLEIDAASFGCSISTSPKRFYTRFW